MPFAVILLFLALVCSCGGEAQERDPASLAFYEGLKITASPEAGTEVQSQALSLFETALQSPEPLIRNASAERLMRPLLRGNLESESVLEKLSGPKPDTGAPEAKVILSGERSLRAAAFYTLGRYGEALRDINAVPEANRSAWEKVFLFLAELGLREKDGEPSLAGDDSDFPLTGDSAKDRALVFFFGEIPGDELFWALGEIRRRNPGFFTRREDALLEARLATARSSFREGLTHFRIALQERPDIFLWYPGLINDLGRCFQFGQSGTEGLDLFLKWEAALRTDTTAVSPVEFLSEDIPPLRYRLLYFAGRIARQRQRYRQSREIFDLALAVAPDKTQADACIWYILDTALTEEAPDIPALVMSYIPRWNDAPYFNDILDRLAYRLASQGQWEIFPRILERIAEGKDRASTAKYAYITGRGVALGYIPGQGKKAADFFRIAYQAGEGAWYYYALAASFLGEPFLFPPDASGPEEADQPSPKDVPQMEVFPHPPEMSFLLGFFDAGVAPQVLPYLEKLKGGLSIPELRRIAEAMEAAGLYPDLIRQVTAYMSRDTYELKRRDLELCYPRPFRELVEEWNKIAEFPPGLLWALIRTESAFQAGIVSRAGAVGLTQLMPDTALEMAGRIKRQGGPDYAGETGLNLRDPETNIHIGAFYLDYLLDRLEHPLLAILSYNGGMTRVRRWYAAAGKTGTATLPGDLFLETVEYRETREYGRKVVSAALVYGYLYYGVNLEALAADICK